jgi:hypothetical protein
MGLTTPPNPGDPLSASGFGADVANSGQQVSTSSSTSVTLATAATQFAGSATATITVPTGGRRYRCTVLGNFAMLTGTNGRYTMQAGYNSGSTASIGSFTGVGSARPVFATVTGATNSVSNIAIGDVFLTAGTYTFYAAINRTTGGGATDVGGTFQTFLDDVGNA